jgi:hypothetical protein
MAHVSFGLFSLIDPHGSVFGDVIIAPEYILLQRGRDGAQHDLSYLAVWTEERVDAVVRELSALGESGGTVVDSRCPELRTMLRAISPTAIPVFLRAGQCTRRFARRRLSAALRTSDAALTRTA